MSNNFKFWLISVGILVLALIITIWVEESQKNNLREDAVSNMKSLKTYYDKEVRRSTKSQLTVFSKSFVWALRSEILRDNLEQAKIYLNQLVKEEQFELIVFVDSDGKILLSTQKKIEDKPFTEFYDAAYLESDEIVINYKSSKYFVSAPVMGFSNKLGLIYFEYQK
ncbi:MAG: hypothetical protein U9N85_03020 [Bacteroidota bacterium]|nr:hypothetical protein [Bacteroidota bacterium]